jgi:hypothetical protein
MNDTELQAERELVADVDRMAGTVMAGLQRGETPVVWQERREQIAALRQRIRAMRDRQLGGSWTSSPMTPG